MAASALPRDAEVKGGGEMRISRLIYAPRVNHNTTMHASGVSLDPLLGGDDISGSLRVPVVRLPRFAEKLAILTLLFELV